ncbi:MAG: sulfotransferase, partial [Gemmatimonadetes bacterium]|nr:sulfotransferase [Gemmatimonadota bacterium]
MRDGSEGAPLPTVVYIAGYGRSGSTMLDLMLGDHPAVRSAGELTYLLDDVVAGGRRCACGEEYDECPVWGEFVRDVDNRRDLARAVRFIDEARDRVDLAAGREQADTYVRATRALFARAAAPTQVRFVVDSSKTSRGARQRPYALARLARLDVRVVHLSRSLLDTMRSVRRTGNWQAEGRQGRRFRTLRSLPGWILANYRARRTQRFLPKGRYLHVRYEDLRRDPAETLSRLGDFLELDLSSSIEKALGGA